MTRLHVLIVGADGFIGRHLAAAMLARGDHVTCASRHPARTERMFPVATSISCDLAADESEAWIPRLDGMDAVVNVAGVLRGPVEAVQARGPMALFDACARAGVGRVIQVSALGAGRHPSSPFLASKAAADRYLAALAQDDGRSGWHVVRPSLVMGRGGRSTALFLALALLPRPLRLGPGTWAIQPLHVDDLVRLMLGLMDHNETRTEMDVVGAAVMTTDELTQALRTWAGLPPARPVAVPLRCLRLAARVGDHRPGSTLSSESLNLLAAGNIADPRRSADTIVVRPLRQALAVSPSVRADVMHGRWMSLRPVLIGCLAVVWIGSGLASLAISGPRALDLLSGLHLSPAASTAVVWCGASFDIVLGAALVRRPWRRPVLLAQFGTILAYTALASLLLPTLWLDPFGALLKNLAVLGITVVLLAGGDA